MRKLAIGIALASTMLATPAIARDGSLYAGIEGGLMLVEDFGLDYDDGVEEINDAIRVLARQAKQVAEGSGAASLAGAIKLGDELRGKKVVGIVTGGNIPLERYGALMTRR